MKPSPDINLLIKKVVEFRDEREWEQFHNLKDLCTGLSIEASELLELMLWKNADEIEEFIKNKDNFNRIEEELADILIYCLLITHKLDLDLEKIVIEKLKKNAAKYPVDYSKGSARKYNEFDRT